jgi:serpin B
MKRTALLAAAVLILAGASCGKVSYEDDVENPDTEVDDSDQNAEIPDDNPLKKLDLNTRSETFVQQGKLFAFDFIRRVNEVQEESFIVSPLSMQFLLGMVLDGAQGETADEICRVLGYEADDSQAADEFASTLLEQLPALDKLTTLSIGNAVFANQSYPILDSYRSRVAQYYDAELSNLDFTDTGLATNQINDWCSDRTNGLIPKVLDRVDPEVLAYLMNALYFKGQWQEKFPAEATANETFVDEKGKESTVPMMKNHRLFPCQENDVFSAVRLPYGNGAYQMTVILPRKGKTIQETVSVLDAQRWNEIFQSWSERDVDAWIPKFETTSHLELNKVLIEMGRPTAFEAMKADFRAMSAYALCLSLVIQDAVIKVDEEGTEAAAVSTGMMETSVHEPLPFHADHPFLYLITESSTGAILFAGKYSG